MTKYVSLEHAIRNAVRDQQYKKPLNEDKEWEKDSAAVKASKDPKFINKMIEKWGQRGGAWLNHPHLHPKPEKKKVNEDFEFEMARNELRTAIDAAKRLMAQLDGEGELEAWVQSKITKGADYLDTVADYMDSRDTKKLKEETKELIETMSVVNSKFKGNDFTTPVRIAPSVTKAAIKVSGHRRIQKQQDSATMQGRVVEQSATMPMPTTIPSPMDVLKGVGRYLPRVALGLGGSATAAGLGASALHSYVTNPENIKKAEAERAGEAEVASEYDKKKAEIAASTAAMKRQAIDDADVAKDAASKSVPKEIETPAPAAPVATERKPNPFSTIAKASKSEFEATPTSPPAANINKSIQIGADTTDGTKAPPIAPPKAGVSPAPDAVASPGVNAPPAAIPAIAAPVSAVAAAKTADAARAQTKNIAQTQARTQTKAETQKPPSGKGLKLPKLPFIPLPGGAEYKAPPPHSEYHDVPVKTSVSQAQAHRKFATNQLARFRAFREEIGPDNTRRKDSSKELVGRPDSAGVKDPKSVLARNGSIKTKIIDEENKLAGVVKSVVKKKKEEKESGPNPMVDFEPKLNHKYDNET